MRYNSSQYEESIDIAALAAGILRKRWRLILACAAGALLLGLYKGVLRPGSAGDATQISQLQEEISKNNETLAKNESDITAHGFTIAADQEKIAANDELIATQQELRTAQQEKLEALRADRDRNQAVLNDANATPEQTEDANSRLLTLANDIVNAENQLNTIVTQITNAQKDTANLQAEIDKLRATDSTLEEANAGLQEEIGAQNAQLAELQGSGGTGQTVKYAVLGGILGILFVCGIRYLQFIFSKKLRCSEELREKYDLPVLGEFCSAAAQKHGRFDKMLDRLSGDVQTLPDKNNVYDLIAAGIQAAGQPLPMRLAVTGTVDEKALREVSGWLCKFLPEEYEVLMASNPVYNAGFLAEIRQYTVLLVEMKQISDKREIDKLADVLCRNEVNVIGVVVL